jgi:hypothetical protein
MEAFLLSTGHLEKRKKEKRRRRRRKERTKVRKNERKKERKREREKERRKYDNVRSRQSRVQWKVSRRQGGHTQHICRR